MSLFYFIQAQRGYRIGVIKLGSHLCRRASRHTFLWPHYTLIVNDTLFDDRATNTLGTKTKLTFIVIGIKLIIYRIVKSCIAQL